MTNQDKPPEWLRGCQFTTDPVTNDNYVFAPRNKVEGKQNWSSHTFIDENDFISEAIRLNVYSDRHREEIIASHFCTQLVKAFPDEALESTEFQIIGRDTPWDFEYESGNGARFNVEICRIADRALLKAQRAENDCSVLLQMSQLQGYQILKIEKHFPGTLPVDLVNAARRPGGKSRVFSHEASSGPRIFFRPVMNPRIDLKARLKEEIDKKCKKPHHGKEVTHLVLDNLTTHFKPRDFFDALDEVVVELECLPFYSIWVYTGYYSDDSGYNCEFTTMPVWLSKDAQKKFAPS